MWLCLRAYAVFYILFHRTCPREFGSLRYGLPFPHVPYCLTVVIALPLLLIWSVLAGRRFLSWAGSQITFPGMGSRGHGPLVVLKSYILIRTLNVSTLLLFPDFVLIISALLPIREGVSHIICP